MLFDIQVSSDAFFQPKMALLSDVSVTLAEVAVLLTTSLPSLSL